MQKYVSAASISIETQLERPIRKDEFTNQQTTSTINAVNGQRYSYFVLPIQMILNNTHHGPINNRSSQRERRIRQQKKIIIKAGKFL